MHDLRTRTRITIKKKHTLISNAIVGAKLVSIDLPIKYPGEFSWVSLVFDNGLKLDITGNGHGCSECDPETIGFGVDVDLMKHVKG